MNDETLYKAVAAILEEVEMKNEKLHKTITAILERSSERYSELVSEHVTTNKTDEFEEGCKAIVQQTIDQIKPHTKDLTFLWLTLAEETDDWRGGQDTYGYESFEDVVSNITYISDRWTVAFRVKWLIDLCEADIPEQQYKNSLPPDLTQM